MRSVPSTELSKSIAKLRPSSILREPRIYARRSSQLENARCIQLRLLRKLADETKNHDLERDLYIQPPLPSRYRRTGRLTAKYTTNRHARTPNQTPIAMAVSSRMAVGKVGGAGARHFLGQPGRDELHGRALHRLGDRLGVAEVILLPPRVGPHIAARQLTSCKMSGIPPDYPLLIRYYALRVPTRGGSDAIRSTKSARSSRCSLEHQLSGRPHDDRLRRDQTQCAPQSTLVSSPRRSGGPPALALDRKKLAAFSAAAGRFL